MITIEVGPGDTPQTIAQRYPGVFEWRDGALIKRPGIGDVSVVRAKEEPVYLAPLKDPLAERQAIPIYPLPKLEYSEPIKVKPRSKRGQRKRMWL